MFEARDDCAGDPMMKPKEKSILVLTMVSTTHMVRILRVLCFINGLASCIPH